MKLFAFAFREGFTAYWVCRTWPLLCCSPSHFEKVSQRLGKEKGLFTGCSPSHFEKVSQPYDKQFVKVYTLFAFAFREGFTAEYPDSSTEKSAVRLRISRRFHSDEDLQMLVDALFAFAFREGFTASYEHIPFPKSCSPSHFEKVSQQNKKKE